MTLGAAVAAASFAFASYASMRALLPIAVVAALGEALFALVADRGLGTAWASAVAAVVIGLVAYAVGGRVRVPPLAVVVSAVVPLLPGLAIYRGLSLLSEGGDGILSIVSAASIAIALAAGVIFGEYLAQPLRREARRLGARRLGARLPGPRLVGPILDRTSAATRLRRPAGR